MNKKKAIVIALLLAAALTGMVMGVGQSKEIETKKHLRETPAPVRLEGQETPKRILFVGNSYAVDTTEYLGQILNECGYEDVVVGTLYRNGSALNEVYSWARKNKEMLFYRKYADGKWSDEVSCGAALALEDEPWDIVLLQQYSTKCGQEQSFVLQSGTNLISAMAKVVRKYVPDARIGWNMTWALYDDATLESYVELYGGDQMTMYDAICAVTQEVVARNADIDVVIPVGTAVQNGRAEVGDVLNRDERHLSENVGRYLAAMTAARSLGFTVDGLEQINTEPPVKQDVLPMVKRWSEQAIAQPYQVTK